MAAALLGLRAPPLKVVLQAAVPDQTAEVGAAASPMVAQVVARRVNPA